MANNLTFILVRTQFAANLGGAARVLKNMGWERLALIRPQCEVGVEARSLAMKGADILDRAQFLPDLETAARQFGVLIGATARFRGQQPGVPDCRSLAERLLPGMGSQPAGIVFGPEDNGLSRSELALCHYLMEIPTGSEYPVLNLAQAVGIIAYEMRGVVSRQPGREILLETDSADISILLEHARSALERFGFPEHISMARLMKRLQKVASRCPLEREDINLLHGILTHLERRMGQKGDEESP